MNLIDEINYHIWAETVFFDAIETISGDQWFKKDAELNKSLHHIFSHKTEVIWFWFQLAKDIKIDDIKNEPDFKNMDRIKLREFTFVLLKDVKVFVESFEDKNLEISLPWIKQKYNVTSHEIIFNFFNHATYHRGQLAILIRRLGHQVEDADYNPFMYQKLKLDLLE